MAQVNITISGKMLAALRDVFKDDAAIQKWMSGLVSTQLRGWLFGAETELCKAEKDALNAVCETSVEVKE